MATRAGQGVFAGPVLGARKAKGAAIVRPECAGGTVPPVPVVELPPTWLAMVFAAPVAVVGPLMAQVMLAANTVRRRNADGSAAVHEAVLVSAAGKPFVFSSPGSFEMWASIAAARVLREVELAEAMTPEARAVWLVVKREKLAKEARNRINAAARMADPAIAAALIADADFALEKWAHYP